MKKNICFIIDSLVGKGAEKVVLNLSQAIIALGHEIHIILIENKISYDLTTLKLNIHCLTEDRRLSKNKYWNKVLLARKLKQQFDILEKQYGVFDLVVSNLEDSDKTSSMVKLHNLYHCYHNSMKGFIHSKIQHKKYYKHLFRKIKEYTKHRNLYNNSNIIAVSQGAVKGIIDCGVKPNNIVTIYNPFDIEDIRKKANEHDARIPKEKYIINVARFSKIKRHDVLLKAYAQTNIPHKLVLLGTTDKPSDVTTLNKLKDLVKELEIEDKVIFTGFITNPYPWLKQADLSVLSSDTEGLPNVIIESLIIGTMVVSTNCDFGPSEILIEELSQFLSPVGDIDALSKNIVKALNNPVVISDKFVNRFDAKIIAEQYLALVK